MAMSRLSAFSTSSRNIRRPARQGVLFRNSIVGYHRFIKQRKDQERTNG